jgi:hypothetical protein
MIEIFPEVIDEALELVRREDAESMISKFGLCFAFFV